MVFNMELKQETINFHDVDVIEMHKSYRNYYKNVFLKQIIIIIIIKKGQQCKVGRE